MLEICCGSFEDAWNAWAGGARRIELNSALFLGGLTPTAACLDLVKARTDLEVICMVRPRGAGFCYSLLQADQMFSEAKELLEHGSDGLAFGFLTPERQVEEKQTKRMADLIHSFGKTAVFHRAFDCVKDPYETAEKLIKLGIDRILTSGLEERAWDGIPVLRELERRYGDQIQFLAGSGVNASNARELMEKTGVRQVHSSCRDWAEDRTTKGKKVSYGYGPAPYEGSYDGVSRELVRKLVELRL